VKTLENIGMGNNFLNRTLIAQEIRKKLKNGIGIASNLKASAYQRKQLPERRDNPQNGKISLPTIH
jgi:hypothetical protein